MSRFLGRLSGIVFTVNRGGGLVGRSDEFDFRARAILAHGEAIVECSVGRRGLGPSDGGCTPGCQVAVFAPMQVARAHGSW